MRGNLTFGLGKSFTFSNTAKTGALYPKNNKSITNYRCVLLLQDLLQSQSLGFHPWGTFWGLQGHWSHCSNIEFISIKMHHSHSAHVFKVSECYQVLPPPTRADARRQPPAAAFSPRLLLFGRLSAATTTGCCVPAQNHSKYLLRYSMLLHALEIFGK